MWFFFFRFAPPSSIFINSASVQYEKIDQSVFAFLKWEAKNEIDIIDFRELRNEGNDSTWLSFYFCIQRNGICALVVHWGAISGSACTQSKSWQGLCLKLCADEAYNWHWLFSIIECKSDFNLFPVSLNCSK